MAVGLGAKIRRRRVRLAMSLGDLAARSGLSKATLSLVENGHVQPSDRTAEVLERMLKFLPGELVIQNQLERTPAPVLAVLKRLVDGWERTDVLTREPRSLGMP